ncbi:hypothetical protein GCM10009665_75010 [Kitasatospora nipponensis]|uniref:DUF11 domain-containing protein n=1 Tax=Kitasatospora nipponensis TaxID=258049 RepID=A0ABP4DRW2_9ACTN
MTEQKIRFGDEGPGDTPLELLLREALAARAGQVTANDLRPEAPPARRTRRTRPLYTVALPLIGLAATASIGYLGFQGSPVAKQQELPAPAASVSVSDRPSPSLPPVSPSPSASAGESTGAPTGSDSPSAEDQGGAGSPATSSTTAGGAASGTASPHGSTSSASAPTTPAGTPTSYNGVTFTLPPGWHTQQTAGMLCVLPPGGSGDAADCNPAGVLIRTSESDSQNDPGFPGRSEGFFRSGYAHQPECFAGGTHTMGVAGTVTGYGFAVTTLAHQPVENATWQVDCAGGGSFTARLWTFAKPQVYLMARGLGAANEAGLQTILAGLDVSGHADPLAGRPSTAVTVSISGLTAGQKVYADGAAIPFSVTYTNTSSTNFASVDPLSFTGHFDGVANDPLQMAQGTMERQDGSSWTKLPLSMGTGMDYVTLGAPVAFPLAPGAHRTVNYRMTLDAADGAGTLDLVAQLGLHYDPTAPNPTYTQVGRLDLPLVLTKR